MTRLEDLPPPAKNAPEGYYPDPLGGERMRWWDGERWVNRVGADLPEVAERQATKLDPGAPVAAAFRLYRRYPLLFFGLAAGVIVPYELIVLATTGAGPVTTGPATVSEQVATSVLEWIVISPLISALHVHAVADARRGEQPRFASVGRRGLTVLPVVAAATIMASLGIVLGLVALIVPGIILALRWAVVAQAAAIEHEGWLPALRRSAELTHKTYGRIILFFLITVFIIGIPTAVIGAQFDPDETTTASVLVGLPVQVLAASFGALCTAFLYYALRARLDPAEEPVTQRH
jgi:Protein of unknown function (DUF2510)